MENSPTLLEKLLPKARIGLFWIGVLVWLVGSGLGVTSHFDSGAWFLLMGMGLMHASDVGKPVIINLFNSVTEQHNTQNNNNGYL